MWAKGCTSWSYETTIVRYTKRKQRSTSSIHRYSAFACGALIAVTSWCDFEDNKGWEWGFGISTIAIFLSIPVFLAGSRFYRNKIPTGSPLTIILKVIVASLLNSCTSRSSTNVVASMATSPSPQFSSSQEAEREANNKKEIEPTETPTDSLTFFNRAITDESEFRALKCTVNQVEDVKIVIKILPTFACTIMLNCCLAQLSTYSVECGHACIYQSPTSHSHFPRAFHHDVGSLYDHHHPLQAFETKTQISNRVKEIYNTSLSWASLAMGYYLSTVIVSIVNSVTRDSNNKAWLSGENLNHYRLDLFYWLMCGLSTVNFLHYLFWAVRYKYNRSTRG
ncbi:hypothetical protein Leryth_021108 [Lithospermum erythrorhizon]|nr:hypothetical protein Leryth_021108 [Lithospermum erythrorhizon]